MNIEEMSGKVLPHSSLVSQLSGYKAPNFKVHSMIKEGQLISLKKGLYVVPSKKSGELISLPLVANHLYGPSYVSLEFALYHYGIIPEFVADITSVCTKRGKTFETDLGRFTYQKLPTNYYSLGIRSVKESDTLAYLMASPEKALCDWLTLTPNLRLYSVKGLSNVLLEDMRMDAGVLQGLDLELITNIIATEFRPPRLKYLIVFLEALSC